MTSDFRQGSVEEPNATSGLDAQREPGADRPMTSGSFPEGTAPGRDRSGSDADLKNVAARETSSMRAQAGLATDAVRDGAADLAASAKERAVEEAERGKEAVSSGLDDFAAAIRKASEELGNRDQSMASNLVREVASGLEQATGSIKGKSIQDLTQSVAGFARRQPTAFLVGAALAGVALGRFARASSGAETMHRGGGADENADRDRTAAPSRSVWEETSPVPAPSTPVQQPSPTAGSQPAGRDPAPGSAFVGPGFGAFSSEGIDHVR